MIPTLIVEDEFLVRVGLKTAVDWEKEGFVIVGEASNGEEGMNFFLKYRPRLILTDIRMPKKDGIALMKEIRAIDSDVYFIVLTAHDEFDYARESIQIGVEDYLLKGRLLGNELLDTLRRISRRLQGACEDNNAAKLPHANTLDSSRAEDMKIQDLAESLRLSARERLYTCCLRMTGPKNPLIYKSIVTLCKNILTEKKLNCTIIHSETDFYVAIAGVQPPRDILLLMSDSVHRYFGRTLYCGISKPANGEGMFSSYMLQARLACDLNIFHQETNIQEYSPALYDRSAAVNTEMLTFESVVLSGNTEQCQATLANLKREILRSNSIKLLNSTLYHIALILAMYDDKLIESEIYTQLLATDNIDAMFDTISELSRRVCQSFADIAPALSGSTPYIEKARGFILRNLHENIKLTDIAEYVHISPNYLGKLFYCETGMHLKDYIISEKIKLSCKLLQEAKYQINEVANLVGIPDQQYFSKIFKKRMGISPKAYSYMNRKNEL